MDLDFGNKLPQALSTNTKLPQSLSSSAKFPPSGPFEHYERPAGVKVKEEDESVEDFFHFAQHLQQQTGECLSACCGGSNPKSPSLSDPAKSGGHPSADRPYHCQDCGKHFRINDIKRHQRIHSGERPFPCFQCGKNFPTSGDLKRHERIHTGERPFHCTQCGKNFFRSGELKRHERIHSGERA